MKEGRKAQLLIALNLIFGLAILSFCAGLSADNNHPKGQSSTQDHQSIDSEAGMRYCFEIEI